MCEMCRDVCSHKRNCRILLLWNLTDESVRVRVRVCVCFVKEPVAGTFTFVMCLRPSVRVEQLGFHYKGFFLKFDTWVSGMSVSVSVTLYQLLRFVLAQFIFSPVEKVGLLRAVSVCGNFTITKFEPTDRYSPNFVLGTCYGRLLETCSY
jgi:hypothetical protein